MAIPFSNTNYRIPRGFANLLEGLTREVLREQPQDIPHFASRYFTELLRKREESGFDPAEWGAALEDRYYNNHSFQHPEDKTFTARTEDVFSRAADVHPSQDLTSSIQEKEEDEYKLGTDGTLPAHTEDVSDRRESSPVLDHSEDTVESHHRPSSSQLADVEHKQEEKSDTDSLLREQSATMIQAAFRGHQAREGVRKLREESGEKLSLREYPAAEEAAPHQNQDEMVHETEDLEPHPAETPQEDSTPVQPHDSNIEAGPYPGDAEATEDVFGGETVLDEDQEMGQTQDLQDEKEDDQENQVLNDEGEDHGGQQSHSEEDKEDNLAITEDVEGHDNEQTQNEEEPREDDSEKDVEGQDMKQDNREEDKEVNLETRTIEEEEKMESQGVEAAGGPASTDEPDTSVTPEAQIHEDKTTEEQQESGDNQDNETDEQLEDKNEESADTTTEITREEQEDGEDPREENEAFRKQPEEALDIALDDPDANAAAAKIQAGFRGHMTRKKMKSGEKDVKHKEGKEGDSAQGEHEGD